MIVIEKNQAFSDSGKYIHRLGSDSYFKKCTVLSGESEANFEEVDEIPSEPSEEEIAYKEEVDTMVREMFFSKNISKSINTFGLSNQQSFAVKYYFPKWEEYIGKSLSEVGFKVQYDGKLYEILQPVQSVLEHQTPDIVPANYGLVSEHAGTKGDPIPYVHWLLIKKDKYYTENGKLYIGLMDAPNGYDADLSELPTLAKEVIE